MNGSLSSSGPYTNFNQITDYIFAEKWFQYGGYMFCHCASDPKCVSEHHVKNDCYLCVIFFVMLCFLLGPINGVLLRCSSINCDSISCQIEVDNYR